MYRRIAEDPRLKIESGALDPSDQLPSEAELREQYDAARNTVRDAIKWLITRGLVEARPGQGTFVVQRFDPFVTTLTEDLETGFGGGEGIAFMSEVTASHRTPGASEPPVKIQLAVGETARALRLQVGTPVVSWHQQRYIDDTPWSLQTSCYPMTLVEQGALRLIEPISIESRVVRYLNEVIGIKQASYRDRITVCPPDETAVNFFRLPDDGRIAVFVTYRTAFDQDAVPFRITVSVHPADRNQFVINVGVPPRGG